MLEMMVAMLIRSDGSWLAYVAGKRMRISPAGVRSECGPLSVSSGRVFQFARVAEAQITLGTHYWVKDRRAGTQAERPARLATSSSKT